MGGLLAKLESQGVSTLFDRLLICNHDSGEGCGKSFDWQSMDRSIHLCLSCKSRIAESYGVEKEQVTYALQMISLIKYYENKIPGFEKLDKREKVRMLLIANRINIPHPTDRETNGAAKLAGKI